VSILQSVVQFFLGKQSAKKVALFRILFGIFLLLTELSLAPHLREWYSDQGFYTGDYIQSINDPLYFSILYYVHATWVTYVAYAVMVISTIFFILGLWSKYANLIMYVLFLSFYLRNLEVQNGGFEVLRVMMFFSLFLATDKAYTLPWYRRNVAPEERWVEGWPVRLLQLQLAVIYFFTAILKLQTPEWYDGSFVYNVVSNANFFQYDGTWLIRYPIVINVLTYFSLFSELTFAFLIWFRRTRLPMLMAIVLLHLGLILTMNTLWFNYTMIACLALFLTEGEVEIIEVFATRCFQRVSGRKPGIGRLNAARF
jgi:hypothetical protein